MNIKLKPIAESKVRQLGGDVCGVLVRTDDGVMAVSEHGRCTRLDAGVMGPVDGAQGGQGAVQISATLEHTEPDPVGFIPSSGLNNLAAGHPAKIYPVDATPSPFESHKMLYAQPQPAVPEEYRQALQDAYDIIVSDANTPENYGSLCRIGHVLSQITTMPQPAVPDAEAVRLARKWLSMTETEGGHLHYDDVTKMAEALLSTLATLQPAVPEGWTVRLQEDGRIYFSAPSGARGSVKRRLPKDDEPISDSTLDRAFFDLCSDLLSTPTTPQADGWARCEDRIHAKCGGRVVGRMRDGDSVSCEKCGRTGNVLIDDGGIDIDWMPTGLKRPQPPADEAERAGGEK